ncbi:MAG: carbamoyltransferase HypF [Ilumatobacteraceae bacterium]
MTSIPVDERVAEHITVSGIVQGVGFRPFVHRLAREHGLVGHVGNDTTRVFIEVCGPGHEVAAFASRLLAEAPPLAVIEHVERRRATPSASDEFVIVESRSASGARTLVAPDTAVCDDCLAELRNPSDRRHRHPFITCTNCGPRFTIIRSLPYDRPATTMASFPMCPACTAEYTDPADRRYHAQPISCHDCGPVLSYVDEHVVEGAVTIDLTRAALARGLTVAVKGLGGFHLACDATSDEATRRLRARKHRPDKPFAIMVRDLTHATEFAEISSAEAALLQSPARPIVLLPARRGTPLSALVAPGNPLIGIMLPYTPVQHLVLDGSMPPLVMTSANQGGTPITYRDDDGDRLETLSDAVLTHDRPIHVPCDDSVVRLVGGRLLPIRRARGYAPIPVAMPGGRRSVLAVGGELKNTFCVASGDHAWVSQHIGDMENLETLDAFDATVELFETMYAVTPDLVAADAHPGYLSSKWARTSGRGCVLEVQHHHAHVAAVMAEHGLDPRAPVIGIAFDGTGYGDDGTIWGGEVMIADAEGYERVAHLSYAPLPGGDAAIRNPCRVALAHLWSADVDWDLGFAPVAALDEIERNLLRQQLERNVACVPTSSMGRLFDAVASLLGLRHHITYEAQAAIDLEMAATAGTPLDPYHFTIDSTADGDDVDPRPVVRAIVEDLRHGKPVADIALTFHLAVAELVVAVAERIRSDRALATVALTGGVFQNSLLTTACVDRLEGAGFVALTHHLVPPNDGGLALGQAYIAAHRTEP